MIDTGYISRALTGLRGLGFKAWGPYAFETDARVWDADGKIILPSTEIVSANGTVFNKSRIINQAIANRLRISRSFSSLGQVGALLETARANLLVRVEELENAVYTKFDTAITANDRVAPDGVVSADKITEDATDTFHSVRQSLTLSTGVVHAVSGFSRGAERDEIRMSLVRSAGTNTNLFVNLTTGAIGTKVNVNNSFIDAAGDLWFRYGFDYTTDATASHNFQHNIAIATEDIDYLGVVDSGLHHWGDQLEVGEFSSTYIPTTSASVTRADDDLQYANTSEQLVEAAEGTIIIVPTPDFDAAELSDRAMILDTREASQNNGLFLQVDNGANLYEYEVRSGAATVSNLNSTTVPTRGVVDVLVITWKVNEFRLDVNGVQEDSDSAGAAPTALSANVFVGRRFSGSARNWSGVIGPWMSFNRALTTRQANDVVKNVIQPIYPGRLRMRA